MAAHLARQGNEVRLFNRWEHEIEVISRMRGIYLKGILGEGFVRIPVVTTDIAEAMDGTDLVSVVVPTNAHAYFAEAIAPHLRRDTPVLLNPGHTGGALNFREVLRQKGGPPVDICETNTNVYICRLTGPGEVTVWNLGGVFVACLPASGLDRLMSIMKEATPEIAPKLHPVSSVLDTSFANINAIMHPPVMLLNVGRVESKEGFYFYAEGGTRSVAKIIETLDRERLNTMLALGLKPVPFVQVFFQYGATSERARMSGSVFDALKDSEPNKLIRGPQSMDHRFISEDIPHGLVPFEAFGRLAGVDTPIIRSLIDLSSEINGVDYRATGLNLQRLGLEDKTLPEIHHYLLDG
jgi:opine dehydrogenase